MEIHQEHFNRKFYQDKKTKYWISTDYPRIRAHRWVWVNIHGNIPKGYHIHHKNEDRSDNTIENLELIEQSRHFRHHYNDEKREWSRKWTDNIRPLTKAWHASEEGRAWHKLHAIKSNFGKGEYFDYFCKLCSKEYKSRLKGTDRTLFCSNKCKSGWRRKEGKDNIEIECRTCKNIFVKNKYSKQIFCHKKCISKAICNN
ncbi:MAG TPA: HNH endonuclease signature motif containing protein [Nitrosopumilaceae archaeon]|nr:HNH endonuclease signature motif containing protein [Nitrosopumilaceae archaeon]